VSRRSDRWRFPFPGQPYGMWRCEDGREVLHDRAYCPLLERRGQVVIRADPKEWVCGIVEEILFFVDGSDPSQCRATREKLGLVGEEFLAGRPVDRFAAWRRRRVV
jgi:hypothetical protein